MYSDQRKEVFLKELEAENNLQFSGPKSIQQADMLEYLKTLSPAERTELLGKLYAKMETWRNEQMLIGAWYDPDGERFTT